MKKALKKRENKLTGSTENLCGVISPDLHGNVSGLCGVISSGLYGNIDLCEISEKERERGIDIDDLVN